MIDVASVLLGAALVVLGVLAAALADRVRGVVVSREQRPRRSVAISESPAAPTPLSKGQAGHDASENEVIAALVAAGYRKRVAVSATAGCAQEERATLEAWTRAALRRCAEGAAS
jgi:hypothetical protein